MLCRSSIRSCIIDKFTIVVDILIYWLRVSTHILGCAHTCLGLYIDLSLLVNKSLGQTGSSFIFSDSLMWANLNIKVSSFYLRA